MVFSSDVVVPAKTDSTADSSGENYDKMSKPEDTLKQTGNSIAAAMEYFEQNRDQIKKVYYRKRENDLQEEDLI